MKSRGSRAKAVIGSGLIAGAVFVGLEMLMVPVFIGNSAWAPVRMIAAIVMGETVLPPPATFDPGIVAAALGVHFGLSILYTFILSYIISGRNVITSMALGGLFGLALYFINFYGFTEIFWWFAMARNWVSIFCHVVFGVVAGMSHYYISGKPILVQPSESTFTETTSVKKEVEAREQEEVEEPMEVY